MVAAMFAAFVPPGGEFDEELEVVEVVDVVGEVDTTVEVVVATAVVVVVVVVVVVLVVVTAAVVLAVEDVDIELVTELLVEVEEVPVVVGVSDPAVLVKTDDRYQALQG